MENAKYSEFQEDSSGRQEKKPTISLGEPAALNIPKESISFDKILQEKIGFGKFQLFCFIIFGLLAANDGSGAITVSLLIPVVSKAWEVSSEMKSLLTTFIFIGFALGSFSGGTLSDKYGRKTVLKKIIVISLLCDIAAALSPNFEFLLITRLIFGFNLGIIYPTIAAFLTEITPMNLRGKTFGIISLSFTLGELYSCTLAYFLLKDKPEERWRLLFALSCIPTLICFVLSLFFLKESPRYLLANNKIDQALAEIDACILMNCQNKEDYVPLSNIERQSLKNWAEEKKLKNSNGSLAKFSELLKGSYRHITPNLWMMWFSLSCIYYGIIFSLPTIIHKQAEAAHTTANIGSLLYIILAELPAPFLMFLIIENKYLGRKNSITLFYFLTGVLALLSFHFEEGAFIYLVAACKFCAKLCLIFIYPFTSEVYDTHIRSTGLGAASGFSRIGGIVMPWAIAFGMTIRITGPFFIFSMLAFLSCIAASVLPYDTTGKELDTDHKVNKVKEVYSDKVKVTC